jgi:hypothetical protein
MLPEAPIMLRIEVLTHHTRFNVAFEGDLEGAWGREGGEVLANGCPVDVSFVRLSHRRGALVVRFRTEILCRLPVLPRARANLQLLLYEVLK